MFTEDTSLDIR